MRTPRVTRLEDEGVRQARFVLDRARSAWQEHTGTDGSPRCLKCYIIGETRRGAAVTDLCPTGRQLRTERDQAAAELRAEQAAAAAPNPDQAALFDV
jgi:hypothetical protein